ncbi:MAG: low specificity L-threonine aldolase [Bacteroidales bacterium]
MKQNIKRGFASDNNAGVHPSIMEALVNVNDGHEIAYGDDRYTLAVTEKMKKIFGQDTGIFFVFIGTAANVLGLSSVTQSYNAIITTDTAHIHVDECGAPEKFTGCKLLATPTPAGKLTVDLISQHMHGFGFEHHAQPGVISITQATELGTVYEIQEIREIAEYAHANGLLLHMDGARLSNAAVALNTGFYEITGGAGVDVLSFGGTKNGMMYGEAVVFFHEALCRDFKYRRKQGMQLASKMRYIAAQFDAFLENELWRSNAAHANLMAQKLHMAVKDIPNVHVTRAVEANAVFAKIPAAIIPTLQKEFFFYVWDEDTSEVRWMCSFDTREEDIERFTEVLRKEIGGL